MLLQFVHESLGTLTGLFEMLAEFEDLLGLVGRRAVFVEEAFAIFELADVLGSRVEAERHFIAVGLQSCKHVGITAHVGRQVDIVDDAAVFFDIGVHAFVQAHQRQGNGVCANRKNDRQGALCVDEFVYGERNSVLLRKPRCLGHRARGQVQVILAVERHEIVEKQGQVGLWRAGHGTLRRFEWIGRNAAGANARSARFTVLCPQVQAARACPD